jgi:hypothetical protein
MNRTTPPEWDLLLSASQKNDAKRIEAMVQEGVNPSHSNAVGQSALHVASLWGNGTYTSSTTCAGKRIPALFFYETFSLFAILID